MSEWKSHWVTPYKRHKSVIRVEQAKQMALCGYSPIRNVETKSIVDNWTREDAIELQGLIRKWDKDSGLGGLNALIDGHRFSGGTHREVLARSK